MSPSIAIAVQDALLVVAFVEGAIKAASTLYLVRHAAATVECVASPFGKRVYLASKVSPLLLIAALFLRAVVSGDLHTVFWTGMLFLGAVAVVLIVIDLRRRGLWYGAAHSILHRRGPRR